MYLNRLHDEHVSCRKRLVGRRHVLPSNMVADVSLPAKKAFPNVVLVSPLAWLHYGADMIRLSPRGLVADILANRAITLTNDIQQHA